MQRSAVALSIASAIGLAAAPATAQVPEPIQPASPMPFAEAPARGVPAPDSAFELTAGTGYTQGFGMLEGGIALPDVATPGLGFDLGLGYRATPRLAFMASGQYHELTAERSGTARGFTATLAAQVHFRPTARLDPWAELGAGYRWLVEDPSLGPNLVTHGFQLARARVGLDVRGDDVIAVGPVIGADMNLLLFHDVPNLSSSIADPRISTFVYAGAQVRFDVGQSTRRPSSVAVGSR